MLSRFNRYPLIIDPSGQATEFIMNEFKVFKGPFKYYVSMFLACLAHPPITYVSINSTANQQKLLFSDPDVILKWSLIGLIFLFVNKKLGLKI